MTSLAHIPDTNDQAAEPPTGAALIAAERERQLLAWSAKHDADHDDGEIAIRAAELAVHHTDATVDDPTDRGPDGWGLVRKHGHDAIRSLTIAGALIAAEIDRLIAAKGEAKP